MSDQFSTPIFPGRSVIRRHIKKLFREGKTPKQVADALNAAGFCTQRKTPFRSGSVATAAVRLGIRHDFRRLSRKQKEAPVQRLKALAGIIPDFTSPTSEDLVNNFVVNPNVPKSVRVAAMKAWMEMNP